jgi:hypothetical protein
VDGCAFMCLSRHVRRLMLMLAGVRGPCLQTPAAMLPRPPRSRTAASSLRACAARLQPTHGPSIRCILNGIWEGLTWGTQAYQVRAQPKGPSTHAHTHTHTCIYIFIDMHMLFMPPSLCLYIRRCVCMGAACMCVCVYCPCWVRVGTRLMQAALRGDVCFYPDLARSAGE